MLRAVVAIADKDPWRLRFRHGTLSPAHAGRSNPVLASNDSSDYGSPPYLRRQGRPALNRLRPLKACKKGPWEPMPTYAGLYPREDPLPAGGEREIIVLRRRSY